MHRGDSSTIAVVAVVIVGIGMTKVPNFLWHCVLCFPRLHKAIGITKGTQVQGTLR